MSSSSSLDGTTSNYNDKDPSTTPSSKNKEVKSESALKSFLSGGIGGVCLVLVGHPLDLIKVRIQASTATSSSHPSILSMLRTTFAAEGIRGLYRGVSAPIVAVAPVFAVSFWGYDMGQRVVKYCRSSNKADTTDDAVTTAPLTLLEICIAGGLSAVPTTALMAPSERIKCLLQMQQQEKTAASTTATSTAAAATTTTTRPKRYNGMIDCARHLYSTGGIRSIYRGTLLTLYRDVPGSIAYFGVYEIVKRELTKRSSGGNPSSSAATTLSPAAVLTAGGLAGMACWTVAIPADVLKSRFQTAPEGTYGGVGDVLGRLLREEGYGGLWRGLRPALVRAFPANAACFFGMEMSRSLLAFLD